jgi:hypothetical protein
MTAALAISTYQASRVILIRNDNGQLNTHLSGNTSPTGAEVWSNNGAITPATTDFTVSVTRLNYTGDFSDWAAGDSVGANGRYPPIRHRRQFRQGQRGSRPCCQRPGWPQRGVAMGAVAGWSANSSEGRAVIFAFDWAD